jgi:glyoxylate reductase
VAVAAEILCTVPLPDPFMPIASEVAAVRVVGRLTEHEELIGMLRSQPVDVLCPQLQEPVDAALLDAGLPRLRCVSLYAVGFNNVDIAAATERGIVVGNTPGVLTDATADCTLGLILAAARRLCEGDREMRAGRFSGWAPTYLLGHDVSGAHLGVIGFGRIGQAVARRALGFGMRITYADSTDPPVAEDLQSHVSRSEIEPLLRDADIVTLHVPLSEETRHLIGEEQLRAMKRTAVLVNTSRGPVVDETALVRALREGLIAGAGLDVYEDEPRPAPGLIDCPTAVLSPHLGSATVATRAAMAELTARNAVDALAGRIPRHCVNPEAWSSSAPEALTGAGA